MLCRTSGKSRLSAPAVTSRPPTFISDNGRLEEQLVALAPCRLAALTASFSVAMSRFLRSTQGRLPLTGCAIAPAVSRCARRCVCSGRPQAFSLSPASWFTREVTGRFTGRHDAFPDGVTGGLSGTVHYGAARGTHGSRFAGQAGSVRSGTSRCVCGAHPFRHSGCLGHRSPDPLSPVFGVRAQRRTLRHHRLAFPYRTGTCTGRHRDA